MSPSSGSHITTGDELVQEEGRNLPDDKTIRICLGYPALFQDRFTERLRAIDPRIEVTRLPVDPDSDWGSDTPHIPHDEPPAWGVEQAAARRQALESAEVLFTLSTPKELLDFAPQLRWIQGIGAGVEQFVAAGVRRDSVVVTNGSGVSSGSMAEFVIGRLLQIWKRFPEADRHQRAHDYIRTYGRTFAGSTLGIVGLGSSGLAGGERARALGLTVLGLKRTPSDVDATATQSAVAHEVYSPDQLHDMLSRCDAVVITAPATPETHHIIDDKAFGAMKAGCVLVNVARGSLVDTASMLESLESKHLGAAILDVFEEEPLPKDSPLWDCENVMISAHSSVSVDRFMDDIFDLFEDNVTRYVSEQPLRNLVDMAALGFS
jgi:phosphoglycerate dehydrogenase-like enzyme